MAKKNATPAADRDRGGDEGLPQVTKEPAKSPLTREEFLAAAKPITMKIGDETRVLTPREFASGTFGWFMSDKVVITVGDVPVKAQAGFNLVVVGSKDA